MSNLQSASVIGKTPRKAQRGLLPLAEAHLRRLLRRSAPSEPWVDAQFKSVVSVDDRGDAHVRRVHDPRAFPPGGPETAMIRCPRCGVLTPPFAFERGVCLDHSEHIVWGRSPSAIAIAALQYRNLRLADAPLPPESLAALRAEIRQFQKRTKSHATKGK